jgi:quinoprotein glucose dehydrogenase
LLTYGLAAIVVGLGAVLALGGGELASLGGSLYYLIAGVWLIATGVVLVWRYGWGLAAYGAFVAATLAWAIWEVGTAPWLLLPRLAGPLVLFVVLTLAAFVTMRRARLARNAAGAGAATGRGGRGGAGLDGLDGLRRRHARPTVFAGGDHHARQRRRA